MGNESFKVFFSDGLRYVLYEQLLDCKAPATHTIWSKDIIRRTRGCVRLSLFRIKNTKVYF